MALFLDGKTFANDEIVVALAVTMGGDKVFAGFVQTVRFGTISLQLPARSGG